VPSMNRRTKLQSKSKKKKWLLVVGLLSLICLVGGVWLRLREIRHYTAREVGEDFALALPVDSPREAMEFAKRRLDLLHRRPFKDSNSRDRAVKWEWSAWVEFMDARMRSREIASRLERCSTAECERAVRASEPEYDHWKVTFKTDGFIPSYYCEIRFGESGQVLGAGMDTSGEERCGFRK